MKTLKIGSKNTTLRKAMAEAESDGVVFLTGAGGQSFVLAVIDEADREVFALRSNPEFMAHLAELEKQARSGQRFSLQQVRRHFEKKE